MCHCCGWFYFSAPCQRSCRRSERGAHPSRAPLTSLNSGTCPPEAKKKPRDRWPISEVCSPYRHQRVRERVGLLQRGGFETNNDTALPHRNLANVKTLIRIAYHWCESKSFFCTQLPCFSVINALSYIIMGNQAQQLQLWLHRNSKKVFVHYYFALYLYVVESIERFWLINLFSLCVIS